MSVSYRKLWMKIAEKEMSNPKVRELADVSASTFTKMKKMNMFRLKVWRKLRMCLNAR